MRTQREVQLAPRNNSYISAAPQVLIFICMADALSAAGSLIIMFSRRRGQCMLFMRNCYLDVGYLLLVLLYFLRIIIIVIIFKVSGRLIS